jgi:hypothetical protein
VKGIKLIIQIKIGIKNTIYSNNKKFSLLGKSSGLTPLVSILVVVLGILAFVGKGATSCQTA